MIHIRDEQAYCHLKPIPIQSIPCSVLSRCKKCFCYLFFTWRLLGEVSLLSTWSNRTRGLLQVSKSSRTRSRSERENWQNKNCQLRTTVTEILFGQVTIEFHSRVHAIWMVSGPSRVWFVERSEQPEFHRCYRLMASALYQYGSRDSFPPRGLNNYPGPQRIPEKIWPNIKPTLISLTPTSQKTSANSRRSSCTWEPQLHFTSNSWIKMNHVCAYMYM